MHESVLVAIFDTQRKKILLTKRRDIPVWVFPGGRIEAGETPEDCAVREAKEETGLDVEIVRKIGEYTPTNRLSHYTHFFEAQPVGGKTSISDETQSVAFFEVDQPPYPLPPPYEVMLKHAYAQRPTLHCPIPNASYWALFKALLKRPDLIFRFVLMKMGVHLNTPTSGH
ncbi:MAG: NUDIX hydrolase [Chlamydiales bacterium]|nr:NUDIX hydrolase [Chlamydiales bacterium]